MISGQIGHVQLIDPVEAHFLKIHGMVSFTIHSRARAQCAGKTGGSLQIHAQKFTGLPVYEIIDEFAHEKLKASALLLVRLAASLLPSCL